MKVGGGLLLALRRSACNLKRCSMFKNENRSHLFFFVVTFLWCFCCKIKTSSLPLKHHPKHDSLDIVESATEYKHILLAMLHEMIAFK